MANEQRSPGIWVRAGGYALGDGARMEIVGRRQRGVALSLSRAVSRATSSTHFTFCTVNSVLIQRQELQGGKGDGPSHKGGQRSWVDSRGHASLGCTTVKAQHHSSRQQTVLQRMRRSLGVRSQSDPSSATIWKKCQEASVTHTSATIACVW